MERKGEKSSAAISIARGFVVLQLEKVLIHQLNVRDKSITIIKKGTTVALMDAVTIETVTSTVSSVQSGVDVPEVK